MARDHPAHRLGYLSDMADIVHPSAPGDDLQSSLDLVDYRRHVSRIYGNVREAGVDAQSWQVWRAERTRLLLSHPSSPLVDGHDLQADTMTYFDYDPSWRVVGTVVPLGETDAASSVQGGTSEFSLVGTVEFEHNEVGHSLGLFWLEAYGGGFFLPFRDLTNGTTTYGAGRYLLDGAKSADLGSPGPNTLLLDFNFSYHPSCMWDPQWPCPLAPPSNHLTVAVQAGEQQPALK